MQTSNADVLRAMNMLRKCHRSPHETNQRSNYYKVEGLRPHRGETRLGPGVLQKQGCRLLTHSRQISVEYSAGDYFVINHCNAEPCTGMPMRTQRLVKSTDLGPTTVTLDPRLWRSTTACRGSLENFKSLTMGESYSSCRRCTLASSQSSHCRMCTSNPCWCRPPSCTLCDAES